jgi:hypothetical protein
MAAGKGEDSAAAELMADGRITASGINAAARPPEGRRASKVAEPEPAAEAARVYGPEDIDFPL